MKHGTSLVAILVLLAGLTGCRTGGVILKETPLNVSETRKAIVSVIGKPRSMSRDGRELSSFFYDRKDTTIEKMETVRERLYSRIAIQGDRRPYNLLIEVLVERRGPEGKFEEIGEDENRAVQLAEKIRQALNQSLENRNVIDDFRSF